MTCKVLIKGWKDTLNCKGDFINGDSVCIPIWVA